jgi:hypothetical protein
MPRLPSKRSVDAVVKEQVELQRLLARAQENPPSPPSPPPTPVSFRTTSQAVEQVTAARARHDKWSRNTIAGTTVGWFLFVAIMGLSLVTEIAAGMAKEANSGWLFWAVVFDLWLSTYVAAKVSRRVRREVLTWKRGRDPFRRTGITRETVYRVTRFQAAAQAWQESEAKRIAEWRSRRELEVHLAMEREREFARARADHWKKLTGVEFEDELGELYRRLGYEVSRTPATGDEGIDLILRRPGELVVVQCKQHGKPAGQHFVRDLYGAMMHHGAQKAVLACPAGFTKAVRKFASGKPIELLDLNGILRLAGQG